MEMRRLGRTDLMVSHVCLGTMTWGEQNTEADGHAQLDYAMDRGINFIDTAEMYAVPPRAETQGETEKIIGTWLNERGGRDNIVIATKVAGRGPMTWLRRDGSPTEQSPAQIREAIEASLARLQTDYVDLYQLHWPDRPMNLFGGLGYSHVDANGVNPIGEILATLGDLVAEGKIRHIGLSNETPWGTMRFLTEASGGLPRVQSVQNAYNLLNRTYELGLSEIGLREDVSLLPYSPLGQGVLSGKYLDGALPEGARKTLFNRLQRYETPGAENAVMKYVSLAREAGLDPAQMSIKFCDMQPFVCSTIIGATTMEQLKSDIDAFEIELGEDVRAEIDRIHLEHPNPCP